jgi:catechol 2,3-dioxygenase-like lactoylglutathione lyase family enzyme
MTSVSVRYIVDDVDDVDPAIGFYVDSLGFTLVMHPAPAFAMLSRGDLRLVLSAPGGGRAAASRCPTGPPPRRAAGTASSWRLMISTRPWRR